MRKDLFPKAIAAAATAIASITAQADDFNLYYIGAEAQAATKIGSAANLDKIVFSDGSIIITDANGTSATLEQSSVTRLFFSTEKTITGIQGTQSAAETSVTDDIVRDTAGREITTSGNIKSLPQGIYIIKGKKIIIK